MIIVSEIQKKKEIENFIDYLKASFLWKNPKKDEIIKETEKRLMLLSEDKKSSFDVEFFSLGGSYASIIVKGENVDEEYFASCDDGSFFVRNKNLRIEH